VALERNDVHSQLNVTRLASVVRPATLEELCDVVVAARGRGQPISVAGGCHAMGGQQFATDSVNIDTTALTRVLHADSERGLLTIEAGADWPRILDATRRMDATSSTPWSIRQKQTGVDAVTLGGSISANAHGRGLLMQPIGDDIEDLTLVDARGEVHLCSRMRNPELFSLVIGGYGLFGVIYAATLRLTPRLRLRRMVDIIDLDDAMNAVYRRVDQGCLYGDFQFVIDPAEDNFLQRGVFACYRPARPDEPQPDSAADLAPDTWLKLLKLAHDDKKAAFRLYAQHYLGTDGNTYWADTMQLSTYLPSYAEFLQSARGGEAPAEKETLVIGEHYVPRDTIGTFMARAREVLRAHGSEVIYGTIRAILRDTTSFLPWAKDDFACVIFNLRTPHSAEGRTRTADTFRALIDLSIALHGSFFLTYHRYATAAQVAACYPNFADFLARKKVYDPDEIFSSDWYLHYRRLFDADAV
jgi:FAD/FMN-containing dehydrogenase